MTTIYLVRHGQASFGAASYDQLSSTGEKQAQVLGQYFKTIFENQPVVISGSMKRHQQTANISLAECFPNAEIDIQSAWNEFDHQEVFKKYDPRFSDPALLKQDVMVEHSPREVLAKIFTGAITRWAGGEYDSDYQETWPTFKHRVENGLTELCAELAKTTPKTAIVYTSGGVISVVVGKLLGLSVEDTFKLNWSIANSGFTALRLIGDQPQLLSFNEHHFLKQVDGQLLTWI